MVEFEIFGPFKVSHDFSWRGRGGRKKKIITRQNGRDFWEDVAETHPRLAAHRGCYVFALKAGRGCMPWYIGKTEKAKRSLKQEVFADEKLAKYKKILAKSKRRSPEMYLIARSVQQGRLGSAIDDLETLLIWFASHRNKNLLNKSKRDTHPASLARIMNSIAIRGLLNGTPGAPSVDTKSFDIAMRFRERA